MPVEVKLFKQSANETLERTTPGHSGFRTCRCKQTAPIGATTSNANSDQQQLSAKGFQLICDPYQAGLLPLKAMVSCISHTHDFLAQNFR